jgi:uncharacterized membrane protein
MQHTIHHVKSTAIPEIRELSKSQPFSWLAAGWHDFTRSPMLSLGFGALVALAFHGLTLLTLFTDLYDVAILLALGFVLIGPFLGVGLYEISRLSEKGEPIDMLKVIFAWRRNPREIMLMGLTLALIVVTWISVVRLEYPILFMGQVVSMSSFSAFLDALTTLQGWTFLAVFFGTGLVFVALVFSFTVVALPMLLDQPKTDAISALLISYEAVRDNMVPMFIWATIIVLLTAVGIATLFLGMFIIFPLLGHASWHAYRQTIGSW